MHHEYGRLTLATAGLLLMINLAGRHADRPTNEQTYYFQSSVEAFYVHISK